MKLQTPLENLDDATTILIEFCESAPADGTEIPITDIPSPKAFAKEEGGKGAMATTEVSPVYVRFPLGQFTINSGAATVSVNVAQAAVMTKLLNGDSAAGAALITGMGSDEGGYGYRDDGTGSDANSPLGRAKSAFATTALFSSKAKAATEAEAAQLREKGAMAVDVCVHRKVPHIPLRMVLRG